MIVSLYPSAVFTRRSINQNGIARLNEGRHFYRKASFERRILLDVRARITLYDVFSVRDTEGDILRKFNVDNPLAEKLQVDRVAFLKVAAGFFSRVTWDL